MWSALGGGPIRHNRARAFWRDGDGWNIRLKPDRGLWSDHATDDGGGVLDLVQRVNGGTKAEAYRWIAAEFGLVDEKPSVEDRKRWAQKQRAIERANAWRAGELIRLRDEMIVAFRRYHRGLMGVLKHGLDSALGEFWAGVAECYEPKWMALDARIDAVKVMPTDDIIALLELADSM